MPNEQPQANSDWFRAPNRREHFIAAGLFLGFGIFFVLWFFFQHGWWFRWVVLGLGVVSILHGARHAIDGVRARG